MNNFYVDLKSFIWVILFLYLGPAEMKINLPYVSTYVEVLGHLDSSFLNG